MSGPGCGQVPLRTGPCTRSLTSRVSGTGRTFTNAPSTLPNSPRALLRGLGASAGVVEGIARLVQSPEQFDQVTKGDVLVCKMTNPAWVVLFTKISGLVTDSGGTLSHPAVVSREFGIPAVVGTTSATQKIKTGQRIRVNGASGVVEILE